MRIGIVFCLMLCFLLPANAQRPEPEVFAQQLFDGLLNSEIPVAQFFIAEDAYEKWLRSQQPDELVADSVVQIMKEIYPLLLETFELEMGELRREYNMEVAKGADLSVAAVSGTLVPGIRNKFHFEIEIAFKKKRRITAVFWVFDAAWVNNQYRLLLPIEERF
jgi:hypothetical protein